MIIGFSFTCGKAFAPQFLHQHMTGRMKDDRRGWSRLDGHRFRVASIGWMDRVT
jgi:hypothetical protein